jgi:serine/threonine-protein kinase
MDKRASGPKPGPPASGKPAVKPPKPSPAEMDATEVSPENSVRPVNAGEQQAPPAPTEAFTLNDSSTTPEETEEQPPALAFAGPAGTTPNLQATVARDSEQAPPPSVPKPAPGPAAQAQSKGTARLSVLGDFKLLKKLGQGGMGTVYKAHQQSLDREVAVKVLSKELAAKPAFVYRFLREARVMARLDHPNILRCYEVKEAHGFHYLAMEYVDGGSVEGWLKKLGRFSLGDALHIVLACARGLEHAHGQGLVHRDVKPDNILLTSKGIIKVADLGLAKATDDDLSMTKTGTGAGTPIYMAPEQARDVKHVDARCDIYALGSMLYNFLTGEAPFKGETLLELIEAKERGKFTPARRLNEDVPDRLDLILDKMLANKPEHRFASCAEVLKELEALGLQNERLSFLEVEGEEEPAAEEPARPAARPAAKSVAKAAARPAPGPEAEAPPAEEEPVSEFYYALFKNPQGKQVTKKLTKPEVLGAIKSGSFTAETQLSRTLKGGYRALAAYSEFEPLLRARMTREKADRKGQKYRAMYEKIEEEEKRRRRWRWLRNLFARTGGLVGFLIWMAVVAGVAVGGYFLIRWLMSTADKLRG